MFAMSMEAAHSRQQKQQLQEMASDAYYFTA